MIQITAWCDLESDVLIGSVGTCVVREIRTFAVRVRAACMYHIIMCWGNINLHGSRSEILNSLLRKAFK